MVQVTATGAISPLEDQGLHSALAEVTASCDDFEQFFGSLFDRLENWAGDLRRRQVELVQAGSAGAAAQTPSTQPAECLRCQAKWESLLKQTQQTWSETARAWQQQAEQLRDALAQAHNLRDHWQTAAEAAGRQAEQLAAAAEQVAELRGQWQSLQKDLSELQQQWAELHQQLAQRQPMPDFSEQLAEVRHELERATGQRSELEEQLETVGERAAEVVAKLVAELAKCRREIAAAQKQWSAEVGHVRQLVQCIAESVVMVAAGTSAREKPGLPPDEVAGDQSDEAAIAEGDTVLDSLAAQFQMLRRDAARRRQAPPGR